MDFKKLGFEKTTLFYITSSWFLDVSHLTRAIDLQRQINGSEMLTTRFELMFRFLQKNLNAPAARSNWATKCHWLAEIQNQSSKHILYPTHDLSRRHTYYHFTPREFFFLHVAAFFSLECQSPQVTRTVLGIVADPNNAVVWMVPILPLISNSSRFLSKPLETIPSAPITTSITVTNPLDSKFFILFWIKTSSSLLLRIKWSFCI